MRIPLHSGFIPHPLEFNQNCHLLDNLFIDQKPIQEVLAPKNQDPNSPNLVLTGKAGDLHLFFNLRPVQEKGFIIKLHNLYCELVRLGGLSVQPLTSPIVFNNRVILVWPFVSHSFFTGSKKDRISLLTALGRFHSALSMVDKKEPLPSLLDQWVASSEYKMEGTSLALEYIQKKLIFSQLAHNDLHPGNFLIKPDGSGHLIDLEETLSIGSHPFNDIHAIWERFYKPLRLTWEEFCHDLKIVKLNGYTDDRHLYAMLGKLKNEFALTIARQKGLKSEATKFNNLLKYWSQFENSSYF